LSSSIGSSGIENGLAFEAIGDHFESSGARTVKGYAGLEGV
jgi:hypothetical protein